MTFPFKSIDKTFVGGEEMSSTVSILTEGTYTVSSLPPVIFSPPIIALLSPVINEFFE